MLQPPGLKRSDFQKGVNQQKARQPKNEKRKRVRCSGPYSACSAPSPIAFSPYVSLPHLKNLESASQGSPSRPGPRGVQSERFPASARPATGLAAAARRHGARPYKAWSEKKPSAGRRPNFPIFFRKRTRLTNDQSFFRARVLRFLKLEKIKRDLRARSAHANRPNQHFWDHYVSLRIPISTAAALES